jgi:hypothetical protein
MDETVYCENEECAVILFKIVEVDGVEEANCPGCGQFGRKKGK